VLSRLGIPPNVCRSAGRVARGCFDCGCDICAAHRATCAALRCRTSACPYAPGARKYLWFVCSSCTFIVNQQGPHGQGCAGHDTLLVFAAPSLAGHDPSLCGPGAAYRTAMPAVSIGAACCVRKRLLHLEVMNWWAQVHAHAVQMKGLPRRSTSENPRRPLRRTWLRSTTCALRSS
jgi:hypothetical protein